MKQVLQNMRDGKTSVLDVPIPAVRPGMALVRTAASLVSAGTERMLVEFGEKNLLQKARSRPDLVKQVLDKARREGWVPTIEAAFNKLDQPMALGYSSAGTVIEVGEGLQGFQPGDRVACAGGGYAVHAEYVLVPQNLLAKIPEGVDFESAAFATLGAIALQGFRLAQPQVGERIAVIGLGLLGLLAAQIARAAGCAVFGVDLSPQRLELARRLGITAAARAEAEAAGMAFSANRGFDAVLICADAASSDPVELAGRLARDHGKVVAVGAVGLNIPRKVYYEKELTFQVSRSYGPGRYDPLYEEAGIDYPYGYVRWTEGRNLEAILALLADGKLDVQTLITHRIPVEKAAAAYELITTRGGEPYLGVLLTYPPAGDAPLERRISLAAGSIPAAALPGEPALGVLGAGNYANAVFLPAVKKTGGAALAGIASASGLSARHAASRFGFAYAASSSEEILQDPAIKMIAILTRHNLHAAQVLSALQNDKAVYCEKPLALDEDELVKIQNQLAKPGCPLLTVGYNRRFAPFARLLKSQVSQIHEPLMISYRVNAGYLPPSHWLHDPQQGGGRILGEGCHFIDFVIYLAGQLPTQVSAARLPDQGKYCADNVLLTLTFPNGSVGSIAYLANGDKAFSKERVEVFGGGLSASLDDFRRLEWSRKGVRAQKTARLRQEKGHRQAWSAFLEAVRSGGPAPISYPELLGSAHTALAAARAVETNQTQLLSWSALQTPPGL